MITDEIVLKYKETKDEELFNQIYDEYVKFRNYLLGDLRSEDKDNLHSNCNYAFLLCINRFDVSKGVKFTSYLGQAITNTKLYYFCREKVKHKNNYSLDCTIFDDTENKALTLGDRLEDDRDYFKDFENREFIKHQLSLLDDEDRTIIIMSYFQGKSDNEISKILKISQPTVSNYRKEALHRIRRNIFLENHKK